MEKLNKRKELAGFPKSTGTRPADGAFPARAGRTLPSAEAKMRVFFGMILGAALTVGSAYLYDSHNALLSARDPVPQVEPLVNWDIVGQKWETLTARARSEWNRLAG